MRYLIFVLTFTTTCGFAQTKKFDVKNYPNDKFKVIYDTTEMLDFNIVLIVTKPLLDSVPQYEGTNVWVQRISNGSQTEKYLGEIDTERGIYRDHNQPLRDTYIIVECGEQEGQINLISKDGDFVTIPGYYYALNKPGFIYTRGSYLEKLTYKYELKGKKGTDLRGKSESTDGLLFHEVAGSYWVK